MHRPCLILCPIAPLEASKAGMMPKGRVVYKTNTYGEEGKSLIVDENRGSLGDLSQMNSLIKSK
jgi:hypothetical protein